MKDDLVGREQELAAIAAFLDRTTDGVTAFVLDGEAGIGKSTLWRAGVAAALERSHRVLTSRPAEAERSLSNVGLGDLFADIGRAELDALPAPQRRVFDAAVLLQADAGEPVEPRTLGVAVLSLLSAVAAGGPLLLAIDDEQWLDASSMAALAFALRRFRAGSVRLLLARRELGPDAVALEDSLDGVAVEQLTLGPVSLGALSALLGRQLDTLPSRPLLVRIHEVSGGNPFYALELARVQAPDRAGTEPLRVPPSLERLLGARLQTLDAAVRDALLLVAAHGRLPLAMLAGLDLAPEVLDSARTAGLVETDGAAVRFTHPLLASIAYQAAGPQQRRAAHRHLAGAVDDPVQRARHEALGAEAPDTDVAAALEVAARTALGRGMPAVAAELAEHASELTPADAPDDRLRRSIQAARATLVSGDRQRTRAVAARLLPSAQPGRQRAEVLMLMAEVEPPGIAVPLLTDALAEASGLPALEAEIHGKLASNGRFVHGGAWAEEHGRALLQIAEQLDDERLRASALVIVALLEFDRADPAAIPRAYEAHRVAQALGDERQLAEAVRAVAHILAWSGRTAEAQAWLEPQVALWHERDEATRAELVAYLALVELSTGAWQAAAFHDEEYARISNAYGIDEPSVHYIPGLLAMYRGELDVARQHARRALARPEGEFLEDFTALLGVCDLWSGDPASALVHLERAEQTADARGLLDPSMRSWRAELAEALLQVGRIDEATRLVEAWQASAERLGLDRTVAQAIRARGLVATASGDLPAARDLLQEAVERHAAADDPFGRGHALLALGRVAIRARQKRAAREALAAAVVAFDALGAAGWAATARAELGRIGGRQRFDGLSPSELRVAKLAGAGRTNREIAAELFLGERTVASHLTHAYAKLGVRSRTELARAVGDFPADSGTNIPTS